MSPLGKAGQEATLGAGRGQQAGPEGRETPPPAMLGTARGGSDLDFGLFSGGWEVSGGFEAEAWLGFGRVTLVLMLKGQG